MPSPPAIDQTIRLARRAGLWMVGPIVLLLRGPISELAPPARCAGALDLFAMLIVRAWPDMRVGPLFTVLQAIAVTLAFGAFGELALRASGSFVVAAAVVVTLGISQPFAAGFALPSQAAAFAATALAALAFRAWYNEKESSRRSTVRLCLALVFAAAIVPAWTASCALLVFVVLQRSGTRGRVLGVASASAIAAGIPILVAVVVNRAGSAPPWSACVLPGTPLSFKSVRGVMDAAGPLVLALSALGGYAAALRSGQQRTGLLIGFAMLAVAPGLRDVWAPGVAVAPALVAVFGLAGIGLAEMLTHVPRQGGSIVSALLIAALPGLQLSRAPDRQDAPRALLGHEKTTLAQIRGLVNLVPPASTIVEEDASVDLLLRALSFAGRPSSRPLGIIPLSRGSVLGALSAGPVFAFPGGQRDLGLRGFALENVATFAGTAGHGLAAVSGTRACVQLQKTWVDLDDVGMHGRVALVADSDAASGPVVVYFSGTDGYTPGPDNWASRTMPGFDLQMFDRNSAASAAAMNAEAADAGLSGHAVFASPYVARLTLLRVPHAPLALPIVLGPPRARGVGKLAAEPADARPLTLCDAPAPAVVSTF